MLVKSFLHNPWNKGSCIGKDSLLLEFVQTATKNDAVVKLMKEEFGKIEVVRGGSVGIESINVMER